MNMFIIDKEVYIRLAFFLAIFASMAVWEVLVPRRALTKPKRIRWFGNLSLTLMNGALVRLVFPVTAVGLALLSVENHWGIFGLLNTPEWIAGAVGIVMLDLTIYTQHVIFHKVPLFWRLHRMHHIDLDIDVTTGARFHPVEILLSMGIKMGVVVILGAPAWSVVAFEVLLNGTSMFNHSNIFMSPRADKTLRLLVVTPDMHRVHHSVITKETDSNFGFNLPWWDRIFGTYRDQPEAGHNGMTIGLANYRDSKWLTLRWMLASPFSKKYR
jgi:sterol desaturase/sphingolipid hydroxylase (fatty acid hydroxylase superfamily)